MNNNKKGGLGMFKVFRENKELKRELEELKKDNLDKALKIFSLEWQLDEIKKEKSEVQK